MDTQASGTSDLPHELSEVLSEFSAELMRSSATEIMHLMRREALSMPRMVTLVYVDKLGAASISEIREHLNLALGTTSHIVDQLVEYGYVSRVEDPGNRRLKQVTLTAKGKELVARFRRTRVEELARRMATMPPPLLEAALGVMRDLTAHLRQG